MPEGSEESMTIGLNDAVLETIMRVACLELFAVVAC